ncbi:DUF2510 domain-containing protein [Ruania suaedae]|uniref:DUF2510 domain-containing protein n=1 Tax=Ruania suaedae TaxID=2897774 RepID=UPI001E44C1B8|nr:DUF2510 domain-containing protein [Ruania suaedae]UFU04491.1 DUF2510 domain-containing protein [Ruania suaedae]
MSVPAGWYPDPQEHGWVRYWDGAGWTERRGPVAPPAPVPGTPGAYGPTTPPPPRSGRTALLVVLGVAVVVVAIVVIVAVRLISGLGSDLEPAVAPTPSVATVQPSDPGTDPPLPPPGGTLAPGETAAVQVPDGGAASFTLVVDEPGVYWLDTLSEDGVDPRLEVTAADGTRWSDDDGSVESENSYDASLTMVLQAGEHEVLVEDLRESGLAFDLQAGGGPAAGAEIGAQEFTAAEGQTWSRQLQLEPGQTLSVDVVADEGDAVAGIGLADGTYEENDDREADAPDTGDSLDPYVSVTATEGGTAVVLVRGYEDAAVSGTVTIAVE